MRQGNMYVDPTRKRRQFMSKRSHTLAAVPSELIPEVDNENDDNEQAKLIKVGTSPSHRSYESKSDPEEDEVGQGADETRPLNPVPKSPRPSGAKQKKTRFQNTGLTLKVDQSSSSKDAELPSPGTASASGVASAPAKISSSTNGSITPNLNRPKRTSLERDDNTGRSTSGAKSPTTPSVLFSRVKERIREKVFQSSEWPNAAAMMQERRQKANDALSASLNSRTNLNLEQIQLHELSRRKGGRTKSDTKYEIGVSENRSGKGDNVRTAFIRRRSISEDTYDRPNQPVLKSGVVCSNEALEAISQEHLPPQASLHRKGSPRPMKNHMRCVSLDSGRLSKLGGSGGKSTSLDSSASTMCSQRTVDNVSSDNVSMDSGGGGGSQRGSTSGAPSSAGSHNQREFDLASGFHNLYPEIVLDSKSKTIIEEGEEEETKEDEARPVREVVFDESGQTWDVYGAEFDPETLGQAIQTHLEKLMDPNRRMSTMSLGVGGLGGLGGLGAALGGKPTTSGDTPGKQAPVGADQPVHPSADRSSWLRWLCLFTGRGEVVS